MESGLAKGNPMAIQNQKAPNVLEYLDVHSYLQDYYNHRKKLDKNFSYEAWCAELGFKSRSFLRMMVVGKKKITPKLAEAIANQNLYAPEEQEYFAYLVKYSQSGSIKDRQVYGQKMMQILKRQNKAEVIPDSENFISSPLLPRLLSLFSYEDVQTSTPNLARIMGLGEEQTRQALQTLKSLGLVENTEDADLWKSKVSTFKVPDNKGSQYLRHFHEKSLHEALQAFDKPVQTRRYKSLLLPMDEEDFAVFNRMLDDFANEQIVRHDVKMYGGKRIFQVNFNIYPVTENLPVSVGVTADQNAHRPGPNAAADKVGIKHQN
jgi:uncharacterized protein (TIGR02147 family)